MGFDEFNDESFISKNKWIIVGGIIIIALIVSLTMFIEHLPGVNFFNDINPSADKAEPQFTLVGNSGSVTGGDSTTAPKVPQKIGSVTVNAGSMEQIEIKG